MKTKFVCPICKKETERVHSSWKPPRYCSRACSNKAPGRMTKEIRAKLGRSGPKHHFFKGGYKAKSKRSGYYMHVWVSPEDRMLYPTIDKRGYISRSHLVWNKHNPNNMVQHGELIHHINEDSLDDRISNLDKLSSQSEHMAKYHSDILSRVAKNRNRNRKGQFI